MPLNEISPPGWSGTVKAMQRHPDIKNPYALAWAMKNKGEKSHYKPMDSTKKNAPEKKDKYKNESFRGWLILSEAKSEFEVLKQNRKSLEGDEKKRAMDSGCVWHFTSKPSCAIWKGRDSKGKEWYVSNTHRAYSKDASLEKAIKRWHDYVQPSS